jgi:hypothetical protein
VGFNIFDSSRTSDTPEEQVTSGVARTAISNTDESDSSNSETEDTGSGVPDHNASGLSGTDGCAEVFNTCSTGFASPATCNGQVSSDGVKTSSVSAELTCGDRVGGGEELMQDDRGHLSNSNDDTEDLSAERQVPDSDGIEF